LPRGWAAWQARQAAEVEVREVAAAERVAKTARDEANDALAGAATVAAARVAQQLAEDALADALRLAFERKVTFIFAVKLKGWG
jgi:hypothetical protein